MLIMYQQQGHTVHLLDWTKFSSLTSHSMIISVSDCIDAAVAAIAVSRSAKIFLIMLFFSSMVMWWTS
jgi:hypothetical protein